MSGKWLAAIVIKHLFKNGVGATRVKLLLSVPNVNDSELIIGFEQELQNRGLSQLNDNIGWEVSMNYPLQDIGIFICHKLSQRIYSFKILENMWKRVGRVKNIWQSDGITNCLNPIPNLRRLTEALTRRDDTNKRNPNPYIRKVYRWTIDLKIKMRSSLR